MNRTSCIVGLGHHAPSRVVPNTELEASLGLEPGWIERRIGIRSRRWALPGDRLSEMAVRAGDRAPATGGLSRGAVGLVLLATSTPDHLLPPTAPLVTHRLGLRAGAVDLAGACTGFLYAVTLADAFVRLHDRAALVVAANILSRRINPSERASAVLFADAAGAMALAPSADPDRGILGASLASDGSGYDLIHIPSGGSNRPFAPDLDVADTRMSIADGREVFVKAVEIMSACSTEALRAASITSQEVSRFVPHQANARIIAAVGRKLGIEDSRVIETIADYGNSSAATIPLSLSLSHQADPLRPGETLLLGAAGAGLTGGALVFGL